jgi:hypothetical protein
MAKDAPSLESFIESNREYVAALRSDDPEVREHALEEIAPIVDDALARELLRFARDPARSDEERGRALIVLGPALEECYDEEAPDGTFDAAPPGGEGWWELPLSSAGYRELTEELRRIYLDGAVPKLVRRRALEAAVRAPRDWQREAAATAWRSGDPEWRVTAVFAMGHLPGFEGEIDEAFRGEDPVVRQEAMLAAGRSSAGEALGGSILDVAADRKAPRDERLTAIEALGELQPDGAFEVLDELRDDPDPEIAAAAEEALEDLSGWPDVGDLDDLDGGDLDDDW